MNPLQNRAVRLAIIVCLMIILGASLRYITRREQIANGEIFAASGDAGVRGGQAPAVEQSSKSFGTSETQVTSPAQAPTLTGEAAKEQLRKSGQHESLAAAFHAARYAVEKLDRTGPHSRGADYFAANPAQQLSAWFRHDGIELASGRPTPEGAEPWSLEMRLRAVGRIGVLSGATPASTKSEGSCVEMAAAAGTITQWFENLGDEGRRACGKIAADIARCAHLAIWEFRQHTRAQSRSHEQLRNGLF